LLPKVVEGPLNIGGEVTPGNWEKCPDPRFVGSQKNVRTQTDLSPRWPILYGRDGGPRAFSGPFGPNNNRRPKFWLERTNFVRTLDRHSDMAGVKFVRIRPTWAQIWEKICPDTRSNLPTYIQGSCSPAESRRMLGIREYSISRSLPNSGKHGVSSYPRIPSF
jgi:hypothetical protein